MCKVSKVCKVGKMKVPSFAYWLRMGRKESNFKIQKILNAQLSILNYQFLNRLSLLQALCEGAEVRSRYLHCFEFTCFWVKNALFDEVYLPSAACRTQRMASGVSEDSLLASFLTGT